MAFKQYKIVSYRKLDYQGFWVDNTFLPYEFRVIVKSWWGLSIKETIKKINISEYKDVESWYQKNKDKWLNKWMA